jgi:hypothetical protein
MELSDSLNAIHLGYGQSVGLLRGYLRHMGDAIKKLRKEHQALVVKLEAVSSGKPDPSPPNQGEGLQVELSSKEMDLLVEAMKFALGNTAAYPNLTFRMSFVYLIALFDAFLADVFTEVVRVHPGILKSSKKQISYDRLLEFGSFEALVEFIASREINEVSYKSIKDQAEYYRDRFGVALEESGVLVSELVELRATRNLLIHNNGLVNHIYLEQLASSTYKLGDEVQVDASYFDQAVKSLDEVASFITRRLIEKHGNRPSVEDPLQLPAS